MSTLRAAMTQTANAYEAMPARIEDLHTLSEQLDDIRAANLDHHAQLIIHAANAGARIIGLGELFPAPYFALGRDAMWHALAEDACTGPSTTQMCALAARHRVVIVAPIYERCGRTNGRFNTAVVIDADGSVLGKFRKAHIPRGTNEQGSFDESFYYGPANESYNAPSDKVLGLNPLLPVFQTSVGRIGVSICYDRHFPHVAEGLAHAGAQLILSPAVTFGAKSQRMWEIEFECDAARHNVFIGGSNRMGVESPWNQPYFGASHFVGPNGRCTNLSDHPNLVMADLDLGSLGAPDPSGWNLQRDRNPGIDR
ncbi:MAG: acyltransferase [Phycisphaerales bacterium]|nr:acyltransferase [Phycisphaerales bacterium]